MRIPSVDEVADYLELPIYFVTEAINSQRTITSIDEPIISDNKEITLHDTIGNIEEYKIDDLILLKEELNKLNGEEKELIVKRYINDMTQQETANELGVSQVQISRNEKKILSKLKNKLCDKLCA